jgi:hypothetical protein
MESIMKTYPIFNIKFKESFEQLSQDEKIYLYHLSRALTDGSPIILFHISYESPALFIIFQSFFSSFKPFEEAKTTIFLKSMYINNLISK